MKQETYKQINIILENLKVNNNKLNFNTVGVKNSRKIICIRAQYYNYDNNAVLSFM